MGAKEINWDECTFKQKLYLLRSIEFFENYGWFNTTDKETQEAKDITATKWDHLGDRELNIFNRWGIEK